MRFSFVRLLSVATAGSLGVGISLLPTALGAQDYSETRDQSGNDWSFLLGAGGLIRPTYEGSDRYIVTPLPLVNVSWKDTITLGVGGLSMQGRVGGLRIGGGLTFATGRLESTGVFAVGDDRLYGMGEIPAALGIKGFVDYALGPVTLSWAIVKYTASGNDGMMMNFGLALPWKIADATQVTAGASANWANQNYMQTYFGVTPTQSINSNYAQYTPGAGIKDVGLSLSVSHNLSQRWTLVADARFTRLTGDAQYSPIVYSKNQAAFMTGLAYRF